MRNVINAECRMQMHLFCYCMQIQHLTGLKSSITNFYTPSTSETHTHIQLFQNFSIFSPSSSSVFFSLSIQLMYTFHHSKPKREYTGEEEKLKKKMRKWRWILVTLYKSSQQINSITNIFNCQTIHLQLLFELIFN